MTDPVTGPSSAGRNRELDGIRGWAALAVIGQHLVFNVFSGYVPALASIPLFLRDGDLAIVIFFALSGDALSAKFLRTLDSDDVRKLALRRYPRLAGVIVFSCLLMFLLMILGLAPHREAAALIGNTNWFATALDFAPNIFNVLGYAFWGVYTHTDWHPQDSYNPFLWTMSAELVGSALIFGYMFIYRALRYRVATTIVAAVLSALISPYAPLFFLGMLVGIARTRGVFDRWRARPVWQAASLALVVAFAIYDSVGPTMGLGLKGLIATLLIVCVCSNTILSRAFTSRLSRFLGEVSFPLYALQFPIMMSFTAGAILVANNWGVLSPASAYLIILLSFAVMIAAAFGLARGEAVYLRAVSRLVDRLTRGSETSPDSVIGQPGLRGEGRVVDVAAVEDHRLAK